MNVSESVDANTLLNAFCDRDIPQITTLINTALHETFNSKNNYEACQHLVSLIYTKLAEPTDHHDYLPAVLAFLPFINTLNTLQDCSEEFNFNGFDLLHRVIGSVTHDTRRTYIHPETLSSCLNLLDEGRVLDEVTNDEISEALVHAIPEGDTQTFTTILTAFIQTQRRIGTFNTIQWPLYNVMVQKMDSSISFTQDYYQNHTLTCALTASRLLGIYDNFTQQAIFRRLDKLTSGMHDFKSVDPIVLLHYVPLDTIMRSTKIPLSEIVVKSLTMKYDFAELLSAAKPYPHNHQRLLALL